MELVKEELAKKENGAKIKVLRHCESCVVEGNPHFVSVHYILIDLYNKLLKLNISFTDSLSANNVSVLLESFPTVVYGVNIVKRYSIPVFFRKLTGIDYEFNHTVEGKLREEAHVIERLIFNDLHMFLSYSYFYHNKAKTGFLTKVLRFLYQPRLSLATWMNDRKLLREMERIFEINSSQDCTSFVISINKKIENFLKQMGGTQYCTNLTGRKLNSFDLAIYSAYKGQREVFEPKSPVLKFLLMKTLATEIDLLLKNNSTISNEINLLPPKEFIVPKSSALQIKNYYPYSSIVAPKTPPKEELIKKLVITSTFFGTLLFLRLAKKGQTEGS